jgi:hypothetical protein
LGTTTEADKTPECSRNDHTNAAYVLTLVPLPVLTTHGGGTTRFGLSVVGGSGGKAAGNRRKDSTAFAAELAS